MSDERVSLVIPGRNCSGTIRQCLSAMLPIRDDPESRLDEIIFVDDGSTDDTAAIVREFPVTLLPGTGTGRGAARNLGYRQARNSLIWFVDSDCVAEPDALRRLLPHMAGEKVGGVSGSYGNMAPDSLLAGLIHEEIIERHRRMPTRVDFLATFNVLYRREALEKVGGFDERYLRGQDAELSWRVLAAGYDLHFELESRVKHYHATRWRKYLKAQREQGYWRAWLHTAYPQHNVGDSYSSFLDHIQPPLALLSLAMLPLLLTPWAWVRWLVILPFVPLLLAPLPLTLRLVRRVGQWRYLTYAPMSIIRAYFRGVGLVHGLLACMSRRGFRSRTDPRPSPES